MVKGHTRAVQERFMVLQSATGLSRLKASAWLQAPKFTGWAPGMEGPKLEAFKALS